MHLQSRRVLITLRSISRTLFRHERRGEVTVSKLADFPFIGCNDSSGDVNIKTMPTITTIIDKTRPPDSRIILKRWQESMIKDMGETEFRKMMKRNKSLGKDFHILVTQFLSKSVQPIILDEIFPYYKSAENFLGELGDTIALEKDVIHSALRYRGRLDGIVKVNDKVCILEWKTVHTSKRVTSLYQAYDSPMQMAAYAGAYNQMAEGPKVSNGILVYVYGDGAPADVLVMKTNEFTEYWKLWLSRLENYLNIMEKEKSHLAPS